MMSNLNRIEAPECQSVRALLSDYIENALSARETWGVDKHLTACTDCAHFLQEMKTTVALLHVAPHRDTADDFMARLHARLDGLEPEVMRPPSRLTAFRDWLAGLREVARNPRLPALGFSLSALALIAIVATDQVAVHAPSNTAQKNEINGSVKPPKAEPTQHTIVVQPPDPFEDSAALDLERYLEEDANKKSEDQDSSS